MSMRHYPVEDMGLYVKKEELNYEQIQKDFFEIELTNDEIFEEMCCEELDTDDGGYIITNHTLGGDKINGTLYSLLDNSYIENLDFEREEWALMLLPEYPSLFKAAYKDEDDLVSKIKKLYSKYIKSPIDYKTRLVKFRGVCYG